MVKLKESLDPEFVKTIDWDHLTDPDDLIDNSFTEDDFSPEQNKEIGKLERHLYDLQDKIPGLYDELEETKIWLKNANIDFEELMGSIKPKQMDILSSGISDKDKLNKFSPPPFTQGLNPYDLIGVRMNRETAQELIDDYNDITTDQQLYQDSIVELESALEKITDNVDTLETELAEKNKEVYSSMNSKSLEKKLDDIKKMRDDETSNDEIYQYNKRIEGIEYELDKLSESYILFNDPNKEFLVEALKGYEKIEGDTEVEADETLIFYLRINTESSSLAKIYKPGDIDDRWELSVIEGDNTALEEMEFDPEFTKMEIITYLTDIYDDTEEVDLDFTEDVIDDEKDLDDEFYGDDES
jgi:predicted  nucleic acid-binding Zn-ribbon protein